MAKVLFLLFLCLYHCDERRNCIYEHLWIYVDILSVLNRIKSGVSEVKTGKGPVKIYAQNYLQAPAE